MRARLQTLHFESEIPNSSQSCFAFPFDRLKDWLARRRNVEPFFSADSEALVHHLRMKPGARSIGSLRTMKRVLGRLNVSEAYQVGMFRSCAVAGSGHDLRCPSPGN